jgi:hypothetical protein
MIDSSLVAAAALTLGTLSAKNVAPGAVTAITMLLIAWPRLRAWQVVLALAFFTLGTQRASATLLTFDHERAVARQLLGRPSRCQGTITVVSSPSRRTDQIAFMASVRALR